MQPDAWLTENEIKNSQTECVTREFIISDKDLHFGFENDFTGLECQNIPKNGVVSGHEYSLILEEKLKKIQCKNRKETGKDMIKHLHDIKSLHMNEFLKSDLLLMAEPHSQATFLDKLYTINSFYRHLNPQQAIESNEKQPLTKYDYLDEITDQITTMTTTNDQRKNHGSDD
ncbi:uncharacterized protein LOC124815721 isoform X2 [Hydra vulgaris]|uniref:Uncharacterized protein LOC124815721 isoform X2 n=1 Tax=Hydra vulgaris TaxID=6087 RepID=A0ABM4DF10_HYDVU